MARFYFHLRDDVNEVLDSEGVECPNAEVIATKALAAARDLIAADAKSGAIDMRYRIDVEDTQGEPVHSVQFEDAVSILRAA